MDLISVNIAEYIEVELFASYSNIDCSCVDIASYNVVELFTDLHSIY